jgi:hypothetical protein
VTDAASSFQPDWQQVAIADDVNPNLYGWWTKSAIIKKKK